jgi:hypothetical protein
MGGFVSVDTLPLVTLALVARRRVVGEYCEHLYVFGIWMPLGSSRFSISSQYARVGYGEIHS